MDWAQYVSKVQLTSACLSIFLNFVLIVLIVKKSPKNLGSYRYLMIYTALSEVLYSILDVSITPTVYSHGSMFIAIVNTHSSILPKHIFHFVLCLWCGFFGGFMSLFCIQFVYRYFVVNGSKTIKSFKDYRIVFWMMIPVISGTAWGTNIYFFMSPSSEIEHFLRALLLRDMDLVYDETTYIGSRCYYESVIGEKVIDIQNILAMIFCSIVLTCSLSFILYFATKTFTELRNKMMKSNRVNRLQSQAFYALVTQTLIPVMLMHFPSSVVAAGAIFDIDLGHTSEILSITFAIFPALDPLPVMLIIQNYRGTLFNVISTPVNIFVKRQKLSY